MIETADLGARGESAAAADYTAEGYVVRARNFRTRQGELDLVLQRGQMLVFCEVKTRTSAGFAAPREAVTSAKQRRIVAAARAYLARLGTDDFAIRFDVVEVTVRQGTLHCNRLEQAFDAL